VILNIEYRILSLPYHMKSYNPHNRNHMFRSAHIHHPHTLLLILMRVSNKNKKRKEGRKGRKRARIKRDGKM
jgi:hypothetical protein